MDRSSSAFVRIALGASLILLACAPHLWSQTTTGTILGTVAGPDEALLPGVRLTIINEGTNARRSTVSDSDGNYQVTLLPPGGYRIEAELAGFNRAVRSGIRLQVNQKALVDITLEIGSVDFEVSVVADAPMIDAVSAGIGTVIDNKKIVELLVAVSRGRDAIPKRQVLTEGGNELQLKEGLRDAGLTTL